ncbi:MAG: hypothetical protein ACYSYM_05045 [Planctomycetota bacterium]
MKDKKRLVQIAGRVQEALISLRHGCYLELLRQLASFTGQFGELTTESRKMGKSLVHGWFSIASRCCIRTGRLLNEISRSISHVQKLTEDPRMKIPELSMLVDELKALHEEFGNMGLDKATNTISVVTESITLEHVALGPFSIQLELDKFRGLHKDRPYHVVALSPNPAATDETVTHPHVSGEKVCEGDGAAAIRTCLEQGRLSDFFTMVRSILTTYNPDSPYVSNWDGAPCYDCGYSMNSEDTYYCCNCEHDFCAECSTYCRRCDQTACMCCSGQCSYCEEFACKNCISECSECEEIYCQSCLENGMCPTCKEEMENDNEEQETQITTVSQNTSTSQPQTENAEVKLAS